MPAATFSNMQLSNSRVGRFILEFFRGDLIRGSVGTLSTSQFISIFACIAGVILVIARNGKFQAEKAEEKQEEA